MNELFSPLPKTPKPLRHAGKGRTLENLRVASGQDDGQRSARPVREFTWGLDLSDAPETTARTNTLAVYCRRITTAKKSDAGKDTYKIVAYPATRVMVEVVDFYKGRPL